MLAARSQFWLRILTLALAVSAAGSTALGGVVAPEGDVDGLTDTLKGASIPNLLVPPGNGVSIEGTVRTQVVSESIVDTLDSYYTVAPARELVSIAGFDNDVTDANGRTDQRNGAPAANRSAEGETANLKTNAAVFEFAGSFQPGADNAEAPPAPVAAYAPAVIPLPPAIFAAPIGFALAALAARQFVRRKSR